MSEAISQEIDLNVSTVNEVEHLSLQELEVKWYLEWETRCKRAVQDERDKAAARHYFHPSLHVPSYQPWEAPGLSDEERQRLYAKTTLDQFDQNNDGFSLAAHAVVHSTEAAIRLDNFKCDYMGDSGHSERFRQISPTSNQTPFDVQFDYDIGRLKHYTESGMLVHIRETSDTAATTREQKLFIVVANLLTGEQQQYFADSHTDPYRSQGLAGSLNEIITLKPRRLSGIYGQQDIDTENEFAIKYHTEIQRILKQRQPRIQIEPNGYAFKPDGFTGFEKLRPIARLDHERHLLGQLALQSGQRLNERGAIESSQVRFSIAN
jgi:hypothetical protein